MPIKQQFKGKIKLSSEQIEKRRQYARNYYHTIVRPQKQNPKEHQSSNVTINHSPNIVTFD